MSPVRPESPLRLPEHYLRRPGPATQDTQAKVADLEQRLATSEKEKAEAIDERVKAIQRVRPSAFPQPLAASGSFRGGEPRACNQTESVYSNKVSKVMQETESVLRQVHIDLDEADKARNDLLTFQLKKKKLTWVPDQLVAACQAQGCGRVRDREWEWERGRGKGAGARSGVRGGEGEGGRERERGQGLGRPCLRIHCIEHPWRVSNVCP